MTDGIQGYDLSSQLAQATLDTQQSEADITNHLPRRPQTAIPKVIDITGEKVRESFESFIEKYTYKQQNKGLQR